MSPLFYYCSAITVCAVTFFCIAERIWPAQPLPEIKGWWYRLALLNLASLACVTFIGVVWGHLNITWSLFRLRDTQSPILNGIFCYCLVGFINYWWHRLRHTNKALWLWFHQIHHSPNRIQALTTYYRNPLDTFVQDSLGCVFLFVIVGAGPDDLMVCATLTTTIEIYFHSNINVPLWTSYIIQSPLAHRIHHMRGQHFYNMGDIPILTDIPFGTFKNHNNGKDVICGFEPEQEQQLLKMMFNEDAQALPTSSPAYSSGQGVSG